MSRAIVPVAATLIGLTAAYALLYRPQAPVEAGKTKASAGSVENVAPDPSIVRSEKASFRIVTLTERLSQPWAFAFLPDGDILITERGGQLRRMHGGQLEADAIAGVPAVDTRKQDGLMDIALHPQFAQNQKVYFTYSKTGPKGDTTVLASARLEGSMVTGWRDLLITNAWNDYGGNSGSRIVFADDGTLFMSVGERHEQAPAQDLRSHMGKILRVKDDGSVPADNPFVGRTGARPEIYAYGVRNPQGLFFDPAGTLWEHEHGPMGGDELNVIARGKNYGWPLVTFGVNYDGTTISKDTTRPGIEPPLAHWVPSISPSGLTVYNGDRFPEWRGNVFLGALSALHLRRLEITNGQVTHEEVLLRQQRVRDARQGPDGLLYLLTDAGVFLRLEPAH